MTKEDADALKQLIGRVGAVRAATLEWLLTVVGSTDEKFVGLAEERRFRVVLNWVSVFVALAAEHNALCYRYHAEAEGGSGVDR